MPRLKTPRITALGSGGLILWADMYGSIAQRLQREDVEDSVYVVISQNDVQINSVIIPADRIFDLKVGSSCDEAFFGTFAARYNVRIELSSALFPESSQQQEYQIQAFVVEKNGHTIVSKWDYIRDRVVFAP